jgi:hypothetical protein
MDRAALRKEIETAFAGVTRDPEQTLHQAQLAEQSMSRPIHGGEWREAGLRDREEEWTEVPGEALDECDAALSFFTPESWRFYLPAYICRALSLFAAPGFETDMLHSVLFDLTCNKTYDSGMRAYVLGRYQALTPAQCEAVRHFLELVVRECLELVEATNDYWNTYTHAQEALESYWSESSPHRHS